MNYTLKTIVKKDEFAFLPRFIFFLNNRPIKRFIRNFGRTQIFLLACTVFWVSSIICSTDYISNLIPELSTSLPIAITGIFTIVAMTLYGVKTTCAIEEEIDDELLKRTLDLYSLILSNNQNDLKEKFIDNDCKEFDKILTDISILLYTEMISMEKYELKENFIDFLNDLDKSGSENMAVYGFIKFPFEELRDFIRYCVMTDIMQITRHNVSVENIARDVKGITINQYSELLYDRNLAFNYIIDRVDIKKVNTSDLFYLPRNFRDALAKRLKKESKKENKKTVKSRDIWWNTKHNKN